MTALRCSSLPLFLKCAPALRGDGINITEWFPESVLGTAAHDTAARTVRGQPVDVVAIAALYGVEVDELADLYTKAVQAWKELQPPAGDRVSAEESMGMTFAEGILTGKADVFIRHAGHKAVTVIDWKTGRRDSDYRDQILGYCALALEINPKADVALGKICWVRTSEVELVSMNRVDLVEWKDRLIQQTKDTAFHPGAHCQYCPRKHTCPAREEMQRGALAVLQNERTVIRNLPPEKQITLYRRAKEIAGMAYDVINEIRTIVGDGGPLEANGLTLEIISEPRRSIKAMEAWPILQKYLTDEDLADAVTVQVGTAEFAAGKGQPRGQAAPRRRAMMDELENAGAISTTFTKKLIERRKRP